MKLTEDQRIEKFNTERGMLDNPFDGVLAYSMLEEELDELSVAINDNDVYQMLDALADLVIVAKGEMLKLGYNPRFVMDETLKEIESRTGAINPVTGKWQKVLRGDEYVADYYEVRR